MGDPVRGTGYLLAKLSENPNSGAGRILRLYRVTPKRLAEVLGPSFGVGSYPPATRHGPWTMPLKAAWHQAMQTTRWEDTFDVPFYRWDFGPLERELAEAGEYGLLGQHYETLADGRHDASHPGRWRPPSSWR